MYFFLAASVVLILSAGLSSKPWEMPLPLLDEQGRNTSALAADPSQWPLEAVAEKVERTLGSFAASLVSGELKSTLEMVGKGFQGTLLSPREFTVQNVSKLEIASGAPAPQLTVDATQFDEEVRRLIAGYRTIRVASFRVTSIEFGSPALDRVQARIRFEIAGITEGRKQRQDQGVWETTWVDEKTTWRMFRLQSAKYQRLQAPEPVFQDVTLQALGRDEAFQQQLSRGTLYWAKYLDAGSGIDFYSLSGVAVGDYDNDGWEDFYVCQPGGLPNRLFRNQGDGTFKDVTRETGLDVLDWTASALFADYDNDGDQDLFLIGYDILLFENDGNGHFSLSPRARFEIPAAQAGAKMSGALADYDRDGNLDLYVCQYNAGKGNVVANYLNQPTPFHDADNGPPNQLFRNNGDGTFSNVTEKAGLSMNNTRWSFAVAWGDYNQDGYPDLYVANDFGRNNLYRNNRDGTFTDVAPQAGVEDPAAGMSAAWEDYDNDGRLDVYVSNIWSAAGRRITAERGFQAGASPQQRSVFQRFSKGNSLFRNKGDGTFEDATFAAGVENGGWAWGSDFLDVNNDGWEDLYIVNGYISNDNPADLESYHWRSIAATSPLGAHRSKKYDDGWRSFQALMQEYGFSTHGSERNRFYLNTGRQGEFVDLSAISGLDVADDGRAFVIADFDNDGDLDLVNKNWNAPQVRVLRNNTAGENRSVAFELVGRKSNRDAVGAKVTLSVGNQSRVKEVKLGSGFLSQHTRRLYFGLGKNETIANVQVSWPSGIIQVFQDVPGGGIVRIEEGKESFDVRSFATRRSEQPPHNLTSVKSPEAATDSGNDYRGTWLMEKVQMPDLELLDSTGKKVHVSSRLAAKHPVLIHLTAENCEPCKAELDDWRNLEQELGPGAVLRLIAPDSSGSKKIAAFVSDSKLYRVGPEALQRLNIVIKNLFVRRHNIGLPLTLLLDTDSHIAKILRGPIRAEWIKADLRDLSEWRRDPSRLALPFEGTYHRGLPDRREEYFWIAYECLNKGFYDDSLRYFQECLKRDPFFGKAMNNIGTIYLRKGRLDEALSLFNKAAELEPEMVEIQFNIGTVLAMRGRLAEAIAALENAAKMDPEDADIWNNIGNAYLATGQLDKAQAPIEKAVQLNPRLSEAHNNLGIIHGEKGDTALAFKHFQEAVRLQPNLDRAYLNLGILYLNAQDRAKALEMFRKVLEIDPNNAEVRRLVEQLQRE